MTDVVVVGAGMAGFAAALSAREHGAEVLVLGAAAGATDLCGGAWDVAPDPGRHPFAPGLTLGERIRLVAERNPFHPYARLAGDVVEHVARAHRCVLEALGGYRPLDLLAHGVLVATELGRVRRCATAAVEVLDLAPFSRGNVAVAALPGDRDCDGRFIAASLCAQADEAGDDRRFGAVDVEFLQRRVDPLLHPHEVAAIADRPDGRARLIAMLARAFAGGDYDGILLPPVLGLASDDAQQAIEAQLGCPAGEICLSLAGPQGLRLRERMERALAGHGCNAEPAQVTTIRAEGDGSMVARLVGGRELRAGAAVLATGKHIGGGLVLSDGVLQEPLAGLPIYSDGKPLQRPGSVHGHDPVRLFGDRLFGAAAGFRAGVGHDPELRALDAGGAPVGALFVAGALLEGHDPGCDGTGLGCAATTGWLAGRAAALRALGS